MKASETPWGQSFQDCIAQCIDVANADGMASDAAIYLTYPTPPNEVWAACLHEVAIEPLEDLSNPFHCLGRYELRLLEQGAPTVLSLVGRQLEQEGHEIAAKVGFPEKMVLDAIELVTLTRTDEPPTRH